MNPEYTRQYSDFERWHWWFRGRQRIIASVLRRELGAREPLVIASLGCGPPDGVEWLVPLAGSGGRVIGVDIDPVHATVLDTAVELVIGSVEGVPLRSGVADAVLALDVLEHLENDTGGLCEAVRLVRPGGVLLVTVPAMPSLWGAQDEISHHQRRYTKGTLRALFRRARLPSPRVSYFNSLLLPPIAAMRWLRRLRGGAGPLRSDFEDNRPGWANDTLAMLFAAERHMVHRLPLPIGVSLLATLRRPSTQTP